MPSAACDNLSRGGVCLAQLVAEPVTGEFVEHGLRCVVAYLDARAARKEQGRKDEYENLFHGFSSFGLISNSFTSKW